MRSAGPIKNTSDQLHARHPYHLDDSIREASTLADLSLVLDKNSRHLSGEDLATVLSKLAVFSAADPSTWLDEKAASEAVADALRRQDARDSDRARRRQHQRRSGGGASASERGGDEDAYLDGTAWESTLSPEMDSDLSDDDGYSQPPGKDWYLELDRRRRRRSSQGRSESTSLEDSRSIGRGGSGNMQTADGAAHQSSLAYAAAASAQLKQVIDRVASLACDKPGRFQQLASVATVLSYLAILGYDQKGKALSLLESSQHLIESIFKSGRKGIILENSSAVSLGSNSAAGTDIRTQEVKRRSASSIVALAWSCVAMDLRPSEAWLQTVESAIGEHWSSEEQQRPGELCSLAHSLSALGHRPNPLWMDRLYAATAQAMAGVGSPSTAAEPPLTGEKSAADLSGGSPESPVTATELTALVVGLSGMTSASAMAAASGGGSGLLSQPGEAWNQSFFAVSAPLLPQYSGTELTLTLSSLAVLGSKPSDVWMSGFYASMLSYLQIQKVSEDKLQQQRTTEQLAEVVESLARLGCRPDSAWLNECLVRTGRGLSLISAEHLSLVGGLLVELHGLLRKNPSTWLVSS